MKIIAIISALLLIGVAVTAIWVRSAPERAEDWHVDPEDKGLRQGSDWAIFCPAPGTRWAGPGPADLDRMDAIALAWPRTMRAFGSPDEGRTTYVTRTRLMGFPDYTTVSRQAETGDICILGRQRYGLRDGGVNRRRVGAWAQSYLGSHERPF